jgi:hypothetical protein
MPSDWASLPQRSLVTGNLGGFMEYDPHNTTDCPVKGRFWEEGFADSSRVKGMVALGRQVKLVDKTLHGTADVVTYTLTNDHYGAPHIGEDGTIALPEEYAIALKELPDGNRVYTVGYASFAAYAVDLLDQRAPGLYDTMVASREDPDLVQKVKEQVNRIGGGLYDRLAGGVDLSFEASRDRLMTVVRTLGLENQPARTPRR